MTDQTDEKKIKDDGIAVLRKIMAEISETPEFKKIKSETIKKMLSDWSGPGVFKKMVSGRMIKKIEQELSTAKEPQKTDIREMALWKDIGKLITLGSRFITLKSRTNPQWTAELLETPLKHILMHADFDDILDMAAAGEAQSLSTQQMVQDVMAGFPSKMEKIPALKLKKAGTDLKKKTLSLQNMENMPPEMLEGGMANSIESLSYTTASLGAYFNAWVRVINKIHEVQPDIGSSTTSFLFSSIDRNELTAAVKWLLPDILESVQPFVRSAMPALINNLCELLEPVPGENHDELNEALANLKNILST